VNEKTQKEASRGEVQSLAGFGLLQGWRRRIFSSDFGGKLRNLKWIQQVWLVDSLKFSS
jgi:hypothetical protein